MPIDLYYISLSGPCRNVMLAAKALGVDLNLILTDLFNGAHTTAEFLKMSPAHAVPVLNDNGFVLTESRAIMTYLADQYGKDDSYYPKDPKKRAAVNEKLYFDACTLYQRFYDLYIPIMYFKKPWDKESDEKKKKLDEALELLEIFLGKSQFVAGDNITLADLALVASVSSIEAFDNDLGPYKNITRWYAKVKAVVPGYKEANEDGVIAYKKLYKQLTGR